MAPPRKRTSLVRRRRLDEEADDSMSVATELADDSQSDISVPSDIDEDADADNSDLSEVDSPSSVAEGRKSDRVNGKPRIAKPRPNVAKAQRARSPAIVHSDPAFTASKTTELMINGLETAEAAAQEEVVDFETGDVAAEPPSTAGRQETLAERRRREHEEYKKKRDADPAFIPNRGAFFMHDQRSAAGQSGFRQFGPRGGRGRGGGAIGGPYAPAK
jgi:hypothetical protein